MTTARKHTPKSKMTKQHETLKDEAQEKMEELLQDRSVPIHTTLESMEELAVLIEGHIEGLKEDITAGRG